MSTLVEAPASAPALYDALNCMVTAADAGTRPGAAGAQLKALAGASTAAGNAFPAGTPEAGALGMLLAMDPAVVRDFADYLSLTVILRESDDPVAAELSQMGASAAAAAAFPAGSPQSRALGVLLASAMQVTAAHYSAEDLS